MTFDSAARAGAPIGSDPARSASPSPNLTGGVAVITGAKIWFVAAGYLLYFGLTRLLGPEQFGLYAVAISIASVLNNVLVAASLQTVSRFVAASPEESGGVLVQALRAQLVLGLALFLLFVVLAPWIAGWFRDPDLILPLRVSAAISFAYALYAALVGYLNGRRRFVHQAALDATFSTLKTALAVGAAALGWGVVGAIGGFALAAWLACGIAGVVVAREPRPPGDFSLRAYLHFGGWLLALTAVANLVLSADLWIVKRLADPSVANLESGLFRAALTLSQLLYQFLIPLSLVVFPSLARLQSGDPEARRAVVRGAMRYLFVVLVPAAALLAVLGHDLLDLLYGADYRSGGDWLPALALAYAAWTGAYLLATALAGGGRPAQALCTLAAGLVVQVGAGFGLHGRFGVTGVAAADACGMGVAFLVGFVLATREFGFFLPLGSVVRSLVLAGVLLGLSLLWPASGAALLLKIAALGTIFLAGLAVSGELRPIWSRLRASRGAKS